MSITDISIKKEKIAIAEQPAISLKFKEALLMKNKADGLILSLLNNIKNNLSLDKNGAEWQKLLKDLCEPFSEKIIKPDAEIYKVIDESQTYYSTTVICPDISYEGKELELCIDLDSLSKCTTGMICAQFIKANVAIIDNYLTFKETLIELSIFDREKDNSGFDSDAIRNQKRLLRIIRDLKTDVYPSIIKELTELEEM